MDEKNNIVVSRFVIPDFKEENVIKNMENDRDKISNEFTNESLERSGFFCVINNPNSPTEAFKSLLQKHQEQRSSELDNFKKLFEEKKLQYNDQIKSLQEILKIEKVNLNEYLLENRNIKENEHKDLQKQISELEFEIEKLSKEIAEKKDNSIEERIKDVKKELNGLIETLDEITKKRDEISDRSYHRDKENLDKHVIFWENLSKKYEETLNAISDKSFLLFKNGITPRVAQFFIFTGVFATVFAGWLFALFSSIRKIDDEDWLFFILKSLHKFGEEIQNDNNISDWKWILLFLSSFLVVQTVITFIGWGCKKLFKKWIIKESNDVKEDNYVSNIKNRYRLPDDKNFSPNFLTLWLQWTPYVFIASVVYVIIQMGSSLDDLEALDISLSGQAVGSGLALILGGLGFAYINNIIIPRIKSFKEETTNLSTAKKVLKILIQNIELFLLVLIFIITFIVMYFNNKNDAGPLFGFVSVSLISGYLLGTGMRYKGLYETKKYLENRFIFLKKASYYGNKPFSSLNSLDNVSFSRKFQNLEEELLNLFIVKTKLLNPSLAYPEQFSIINENQSDKNHSKPKRISFSYNAKRFLYLVKKEPQNNIQNYTYINKQDTVMFPVQTQKINTLEKDRNEKKLEMEVVLESIKDMNEGRSDYQKDVRLLEAEILFQVNKCKTNISKTFESYNEIINFHNKSSLEYEVALQNGYDLGYWHLKYAAENGLKNKFYEKNIT